MKRKGDIAILILAAGESRRMKGIKQLLPWKDSSLLEHTIRTIKKVQEKSIYVVLGAYKNEIEAQIDFRKQGVLVIENKDWKNGLGSSIACSVGHVLYEESGYDGVLICLADQPLLDSIYYKTMIMEFKSGNFPIVASKYNKNVGVPAIFKSTIASELMALKEDHGAKEVLLKYQESIKVVNPDNKIEDIDTYEVYSEIYKQYN